MKNRKPLLLMFALMCFGYDVSHAQMRGPATPRGATAEQRSEQRSKFEAERAAELKRQKENEEAGRATPPVSSLYSVKEAESGNSNAGTLYRYDSEILSGTLVQTGKRKKVWNQGTSSWEERVEDEAYLVKLERKDESVDLDLILKTVDAISDHAAWHAKNSGGLGEYAILKNLSVSLDDVTERYDGLMIGRLRDELGFRYAIQYAGLPADQNLSHRQWNTRIIGFDSRALKYIHYGLFAEAHERLRPKTIDEIRKEVAAKGMTMSDYLKSENLSTTEVLSGYKGLEADTVFYCSLWVYSNLYSDSLPEDKIKVSLVMRSYKEEHGQKKDVTPSNANTYDVYLDPRFSAFSGFVSEMNGEFIWKRLEQVRPFVEGLDPESPATKRLIENLYRYVNGLEPIAATDPLPRN